MTNLERAQDLAALSGQGQTMEAFEKYYHENCVIKEMPSGEVREGKEAQRKAIQEWFGSVEELHGGGVGAITGAGDHTCTESWYDLTVKGGGRMKMEEVAVQRWQDGQIIEEKFYYHMPGQ